MLLGTEVGLGPGDIVLDGDPDPQIKGILFWFFGVLSIFLNIFHRFFVSGILKMPSIVYCAHYCNTGCYFKFKSRRYHEQIKQ